MSREPEPGSYRAFEVEQQRIRRHDLVRDTAIVVVAAIVVAVATLVRTVPNPQYDVALAVTDQLEEAWQRYTQGEVELTEAPAEVVDGVLGARVSETLVAFTAEAGPECYVLWLDRQDGRHVRTLPRGEPCEPSLAVTSPTPGSWDRVGATATPDEPRARWETVLPESESARAWFLPVTLVAVGILLAALVRIVIALVTGKPSRLTRS